MALTKITGEGVGAVDDVTIEGHASVGVNAVDATRALTVAGSTDDSSASGLVVYNSSLASKFSVRNDGYITAAGDIQVGGSLYVGGAAAANALDDYEEGTWTPTLRFGGSTTGISYSSQLGRYTKIGDTVHVQVFIALSSKGSASGSADISGLPFGQKSGGFHCFGINVFNWASGTNYPAGQVNQNESVVQIKQLGTDTSFTNSAFSNTTGLRMSFMYITG